MQIKYETFWLLYAILLKAFVRVRTLTGKEIELDIEPDYKVR